MKFVSGWSTDAFPENSIAEYWITFFHDSYFDSGIKDFQKIFQQ